MRDCWSISNGRKQFGKEKRGQISLSTEGVHFQKHRDVTVSQPKIYLKWALSLPKEITAGTVAEVPCYSAEVASASFLITINCVLRWKRSWAFISSFQCTIIFCNLWQIEKNSTAAWKVSDLSSVAYLTWYRVLSLAVSLFYSHYLLNCHLQATREVACLKWPARQKHCIDL